ncbi:hypothetical protein LguiA_001404 [Lonicera macranthoides]
MCTTAHGGGTRDCDNASETIGTPQLGLQIVLPRKLSFVPQVSDIREKLIIKENNLQGVPFTMQVRGTCDVLVLLIDKFLSEAVDLCHKGRFSG